MLLERAIEDEKLNVIEFLLKNGVNIITVVSQKERRYHILKTKNGQTILNYAIENCSNKTLKLLLQNVNIKQSILKSEDQLYKLYKDNKALFTAVAEDCNRR